MILGVYREKRMSRLIDKLTKQRQSEPQPMGFMLSKPKDEKPKLLLIAEMAVDIFENSADSLKGVDAILLDVIKVEDLSVAEKACQSKDGVPAGGWLKSATTAIVKKALNIECDFIAFPSVVPVMLTHKEKLGRILELDINLSDGLLRASGDLPVDAVVATGKPAELVLTLNRLMYIQRLLHSVNKPVLVAVPDNLSGPEMQSLWDMGVSGIVVEVSDEKGLGNLLELRKLVDKLAIPAYRKKNKTMAILPRNQAEAAAPQHEEEEEGDE
jgi:hypothetical protein